MPSYVTRDFYCTMCDLTFEEMVTREEDQTGTYACPQCEAQAKRTVSAPNVAAYSAMSPEMRKDSLARRSKKHSIGLMKENPQKFGFKK